jgi:hypothetical protein
MMPSSFFREEASASAFAHITFQAARFTLLLPHLRSVQLR